MSTTKFTKKYNIILIAIISVLITIIVILLMQNNADKAVICNENSFKEKITNSNALTMMYETEAGSGEYQVSSDTTWPQEGYTFNETLSKCENGSKLSWDDENKKVLLQTNISDKCFVYFDKEPGTLASYIINNVYTGTDGVNDLYYHDGVGSYTNADQEAGDYSYRYSGANPNNYVCFGATGADCQNEDNQYRIIGVFNNQIKLIKATSYGNYAWASSGVNTWDGTTKPEIYITLNTTYYNTLGSEWQNLIAETAWQVGGTTNDGTRKEVFNEELGESQHGYEETMKVGLMYISDYGYGADPIYWETHLFNYDTASTANWLYLESSEWTITRYSNDNSSSEISNDLQKKYYADFLAIAPPTSDDESTWNIESGRAFNFYVSSNLVIRPTFYLNSDVQYISGSGTQSDPFRIA